MEEDTAQSIGIVGGGEIGRAIVEGLYNGGSVSPEAFLSPGSPRRRQTVRALRGRPCVRRQPGGAGPLRAGDVAYVEA